MVRYYAIVPAAGSGSRFGAETPKQYLPLLGRPLIWHTLDVLCRHPRIDRVWVVSSPDDAWWPSAEWQELWLALGPKLEVVGCGGASRAESVANGLRAAATAIAEEDWVLVHDAARPCLSRALLDRLMDELSDDRVGGLLAVPVADTLKRADARQVVLETLPREDLWQAQTPQMFRYGLLQAALAQCQVATDEAGAMEAAGHRPRLVKGEAGNLKVTYPDDLGLAEWILRGRRAGE
ncbi:MAG: 2-C-methyl-D-erythritol 4-phosphate cytidylyltransferase [Azovibrio sp.]|uniref:2-C-methyl-D-erythritol 4-phosphate cytidylyltransferase n=1 Tax=Azovibrio sp. TaxID=1872673 RepID=UPI003C72DA35